MAERFVIVHRTYDPVQADHLGELLRDGGIPARVLGTRHGAVIGVGQNILQLHIEVPEAYAGRATDFLEAYFEADGAELLREAGLEVDDADDEEPVAGDEPSAGPRPLRPLLAAGSALLIFGGSHLYSRRPWTAGLLAAGQLLAILRIVSADYHAAMGGALAMFLIVGFDLIGGQVAVQAQRHGRQVSALRQLIAGAAFVIAALGLGQILGAQLTHPVDRDRYEEPRQAPEPRPAFGY